MKLGVYPARSSARDESLQRVSSSPKPRLTTLTLLITDLLALLMSAGVAAQVWVLINSDVNLALFFGLWPTLCLFALGYALAGLYPGVGLGPVEELRRLSVVSTALYLGTIVVLFLAEDLEMQSRGIFLSSWLLSLLLLPLGRAATRELFSKQTWWGLPVLVFGAGNTSNVLVRRLIDNPGLGFKVLACLDDDTGKGDSVHGVPVIHSLSRAPELARAFGVRHLLVAMPSVEPGALGRLLQRYAGVFPYLIVVPDLFGLPSLGLSVRDLAGVIGLQVRQNLLLPHNRLLKRCLDVLLMLPLALLALPIVAVAALWVRAVSPGNPFYAQEREGFGGKRIRVWKLRTMFEDADALLKTHLQAHPEARREWERFYKLKNDPRILPGIGAVLRKTSLDELPQVWNILKGDMSIVGPRPFPYYHLEPFSDEFRALRRQVVPGLTGMWQVSSRSEGDLEVQERLDSYYIRNWSLWLDLYLIARTPWAVLFGRGAY